MAEDFADHTMPGRLWADRLPDKSSGIWSAAENKPWHSSTAYVREDIHLAALERIDALVLLLNGTHESRKPEVKDATDSVAL